MLDQTAALLFWSLRSLSYAAFFFMMQDNCEASTMWRGETSIIQEKERMTMQKAWEISPVAVDQGAQPFQELTWDHYDEAFVELQSELRGFGGVLHCFNSCHCN